MCLRRAPEKYITGAALDRAGVDRLWGPPHPPIHWLRWRFPRGLSGHQVPRSGMVELYLRSPICLPREVLYELGTGTTFLHSGSENAVKNIGQYVFCKRLPVIRAWPAGWCNFLRVYCGAKNLLSKSGTASQTLSPLGSGCCLIWPVTIPTTFASISLLFFPPPHCNCKFWGSWSSAFVPHPSIPGNENEKLLWYMIR
jgi:hypothetical protein